MATFELNVKINGVEQSITTIGGLEQALAETNQQLKGLDEGSKEFKFLSNQASNLEKVIGALNQDVKQFDSTLKTTANDAKQLNQSFTQTADAASKFSNSAQSVKKVSDEISTTAKTTTSLRAELRQVIQELQQLEPGSARFQQLSLRAGELRDTIGDTNKVVTALAGNTTERLGNALTGVANIGITGLQALTGAIGLFGGESERVQQIFQKLQGLLLITQSISAFGGLKDQIAQITAGFSSLTSTRGADLAVQEAQTAATTAQTGQETLNTISVEANTVATEAKVAATEADIVATEGAAVATRGFTAALAANPLGLIAVALTTVIAGLVLFGGETEKAAESTDDLVKRQKEQVNQANSTAEALTQLAFETARLNALQIKDVDARNKALESANREFIKSQEKDIVEYQRNQESLFQTLLSQANKYQTEFQKTTETTSYSEYGVERFQTITKLGEAEISAKRKQIAELSSLEKLRNAATANNTKNLTTAEKIALIERLTAELEITTGTYNELLKAQLKYLKQSNVEDKKAAADKINNLIKDLNDQKVLIQKEYANQLKALSQAREREIQVENQKAEQAEQERKNRLERARQQYQQAYEKITSSIQSALTDANNIEAKYAEDIKRLTFKNKLEELDFEQQKEKERIAALVKSKTDEINKSVLKQGEKNKKIRNIENEFGEAVFKLDQFYLQRRLNLINDEVSAELKKSDDLRVINDVLQKEIAFGDQNASDNRRALKLQELQFEIDETKQRIQRAKETNAIERFLLFTTTGERIQSFRQLTQDRKDNLDAEIKLLQEKETIETQIVESERVKRIANFEELLRKQFGQDELDRQRRFKAESDAINKQFEQGLITEQQKIDAIRKLNEAALQQETLNEVLAAKKGLSTELEIQKNLLAQKLITQDEYNKNVQEIETKYQQRIDKIKTDGQNRINTGQLAAANALGQAEINATEEAESKKLGIVKKYEKLRADTTKMTEQELLDYRLKVAEQIAQKLQEGFDLVFNFANELTNLRRTQDENDLIDLRATNETRQNEITTQFNNEVKALKEKAQSGLITEQQYNDAILALETSRSESVQNLQDEVAKKELDIKKKAFENEKKARVATAIMSGIQGALQAFVGPFSNPVLVATGVAPILGGILAALVGATTGVQVAAIKKQKFDGGGSSTQVQPIDTGFASGNLTTSGGGGGQLQQMGGGFTSFTPFATGAGQGGTTTTTTAETAQNSQRVYVLESDITATQNRVRVLENAATFG